MPKCTQFISNCSWSNKELDCCKIFDIQKTFYGLCYTFNSLTSLKSTLKEPRETDEFGVDTGLVVTIQLDNLTNAGE